MTAVVQRIDSDEVAGKLAAGKWMVYPYEAYGLLDRAEWNDQLVKYLAERDVDAEVIDIPKKSVVVVVNVDAVPTPEQVQGSVAAIDHLRALGRL